MKLSRFFAPLVLGAAALFACSAAPQQDGTTTTSEELIAPPAPDAGGVLHPCGPGVVGNPRCPAGYMCRVDGIDTGHCIAIPKPKPHCIADTECDGPLPQECRVCEDGTLACAHWTCESGACAVATCPTP